MIPDPSLLAPFGTVLEVGAVVQLRSGGPPLTITSIQDPKPGETSPEGKVLSPPRQGLAFCRWFDTTGVMHQAPFPFPSLMPCPTLPHQPSLIPVAQELGQKLPSSGKPGENKRT